MEATVGHLVVVEGREWKIIGETGEHWLIALNTGVLPMAVQAIPKECNKWKPLPPPKEEPQEADKSKDDGKTSKPAVGKGSKP